MQTKNQAEHSIKAERIKLYELRKDLSKLEKKIDQLKSAVEINPNDTKSLSDLQAKEIKWLENQ